MKACDCDGGVSYEVHEIIEPKKKTFNERLSVRMFLLIKKQQNSFAVCCLFVVKR